MVTVSITEENVFTVLRNFLVGVLPSTVEVIDGQDNRVPEPASPDFITMTSGIKVRLSTNIDGYTDGYPSEPGSENFLAPTQFSIQLDIHGPNSSDNAQLITTLMRDDYACEQMQLSVSGFDVAPLYTDDPKQIPFINSEKQYENRWVVECVLQFNPIVQVPMQFFTVAEVGLIDVDEAYKP